MIVAITGGIGCGKSYVCRILEAHGVAVYDCDAGAKRLMRSDSGLQAELRALVGDEVYGTDGRLQKSVLASFLLESERNKQAVNDVVHPAVALDFERSGYEWLESAILFESGFDQRTHFDHVVCVTAPADVRLRRVMERDHISQQKAQAWIDAQMPQEEILDRSDFEIVNDGERDVEAQVVEMLEILKYGNMERLAPQKLITSLTSEY